MKIRNGFVSNSSSSSFMIYGASISKDDIARALAADLSKQEIEEIGLEDGLSADEREERILDYVRDDLVWNAEKKFKGVEFHGGYDWDDLYVGLSWDSVKDDETGKEFKARAAALIEKHFGKKKLATHSEVVYDG